MRGGSAAGVFFVGGSAGSTRSQLVFTDDVDFDFSQHAVTGFAGYTTPTGWTVQGALGAIVAGELERDDNTKYDISPGAVASLTGSRRWTPSGGPWFVSGSLSAGAAWSAAGPSGADAERLLAFDLRLGVVAGRTFAELWNPYLLARAFGGPVMWTVDGEDITGSDAHHYQLGAGLSVATRRGFNVVVDLSVLGEQSAALALSWQL
jgi:hypothetical protein